MFNDDVTALCPECGSADVYYSSTEIGCRACHLVEAFGFDFQNPNATTDQINRANAMRVLQTWNFAG